MVIKSGLVCWKKKRNGVRAEKKEEKKETAEADQENKRNVGIEGSGRVQSERK